MSAQSELSRQASDRGTAEALRQMCATEENSPASMHITNGTIHAGSERNPPSMLYDDISQLVSYSGYKSAEVFSGGSCQTTSTAYVMDEVNADFGKVWNNEMAGEGREKSTNMNTRTMTATTNTVNTRTFKTTKRTVKRNVKDKNGNPVLDKNGIPVEELVDVSVDVNGNLIDGSGNVVAVIDVNGNAVDGDGNVVLDQDGNPVQFDSSDMNNSGMNNVGANNSGMKSTVGMSGMGGMNRNIDGGMNRNIGGGGMNRNIGGGGMNRNIGGGGMNRNIGGGMNRNIGGGGMNTNIRGGMNTNIGGGMSRNNDGGGMNTNIGGGMNRNHDGGGMNSNIHGGGMNSNIYGGGMNNTRGGTVKNPKGEVTRGSSSILGSRTSSRSDELDRGGSASSLPEYLRHGMDSVDSLNSGLEGQGSNSHTARGGRLSRNNSEGLEYQNTGELDFLDTGLEREVTQQYFPPTSMEEGVSAFRGEEGSSSFHGDSGNGVHSTFSTAEFIVSGDPQSEFTVLNLDPQSHNAAASSIGSVSIGGSNNVIANRLASAGSTNVPLSGNGFNDCTGEYSNNNGFNNSPNGQPSGFNFDTITLNGCALRWIIAGVVVLFLVVIALTVVVAVHHYKIGDLEETIKSDGLAIANSSRSAHGSGQGEIAEASNLSTGHGKFLSRSTAHGKDKDSEIDGNDGKSDGKNNGKANAKAGTKTKHKEGVTDLMENGSLSKNGGRNAGVNKNGGANKNSGVNKNGGVNKRGHLSQYDSGVKPGDGSSRNHDLMGTVQSFTQEEYMQLKELASAKIARDIAEQNVQSNLQLLAHDEKVLGGTIGGGVAGAIMGFVVRGSSKTDSVALKTEVENDIMTKVKEAYGNGEEKDREEKKNLMQSASAALEGQKKLETEVNQLKEKVKDDGKITALESQVAKLEASQQSHADLVTQVQRLEKAERAQANLIQEVKKRCLATETDVKRGLKTVAEQQAEMSKMDEQIAAVDTRTKRLEAQQKTVSKATSEAREEVSQAVRKADEAMAQFAKLEQAQQSHVVPEKDFSQMQAQLSTMRKQWEEEKEQAQREQQNLQKKVTQLVENLISRDEVSDLKSQVAQLKSDQELKTNSVTQQQIALEEQMRTQVEQRVKDTCDATITDVKAKLDAIQQEGDNHKEEMSDMRKKLEQLPEKFSSVEKWDEMEKKFRDFQQAVESLKQDAPKISDSQTLTDPLGEKVANLTEMVSALQKESVATIQKEVSALQERFEQAIRSGDVTASLKMKLEAENAKMQESMNNQFSKASTKQKETFEDVEVKVSQATNEAKAAKEEASKAVGQVEAALVRLAELEKAQRRIAEPLRPESQQQFQQQIDQQQQQQQRLQQQHQVLEQEIIRQKELLAQLQQNQKQIHEQWPPQYLQHLQRHIDQVKQPLEQEQRGVLMELKQLQTQVEQHKQELEKVSQSLPQNFRQTQEALLQQEKQVRQQQVAVEEIQARVGQQQQLLDQAHAHQLDQLRRQQLDLQQALGQFQHNVLQKIDERFQQQDQQQLQHHQEQVNQQQRFQEQVVPELIRKNIQGQVGQQQQSHAHQLQQHREEVEQVLSNIQQHQHKVKQLEEEALRRGEELTKALSSLQAQVLQQQAAVEKIQDQVGQHQQSVGQVFAQQLQQGEQLKQLHDRQKEVEQVLHGFQQNQQQIVQEVRRQQGLPGQLQQHQEQVSHQQVVLQQIQAQFQQQHQEQVNQQQELLTVLQQKHDKLVSDLTKEIPPTGLLTELQQRQDRVEKGLQDLRENGGVLGQLQQQQEEVRRQQLVLQQILEQLQQQHQEQVSQQQHFQQVVPELSRQKVDLQQILEQVNQQQDFQREVLPELHRQKGVLQQILEQNNQHQQQANWMSTGEDLMQVENSVEDYIRESKRKALEEQKRVEQLQVKGKQLEDAMSNNTAQLNDFAHVVLTRIGTLEQTLREVVSFIKNQNPSLAPGWPSAFNGGSG